MAVGLGVFLIFKSNRSKKMAEKFVPTVVPEGKSMGWNWDHFVGKAEIALTDPIEVIMPDGTIQTIKPIAGQKATGDVVRIIESRFVDLFNKMVGHLYLAWNGRFGQPLIVQNPGRMVIYASKHPTFGWVMGGAEEPRTHCNGTMFSAAGGYDPAAGSELKAIMEMPDGPDKTTRLEAYGKASAAREVLEEMGLVVTDIKEVGKGLSNRSIYATDLGNVEVWHGETYYLVIVPADLLEDVDGKLIIQLPEDKQADVQPAPEWSSIKKLEFRPALQCFRSYDTVAVGGYAKAYDYCVNEIDKGVTLTVDEALTALKIAILAGE